MKRDRHTLVLGRDEPLKAIHERMRTADIAIQELLKSIHTNKPLSVDRGVIQAAVLGLYLELEPYIALYADRPELKFEVEYIEKLDPEKYMNLQNETVVMDTPYGMVKEVRPVPPKMSNEQLIEFYRVLRRVYVKLDFAAPTPKTLDVFDIGEVEADEEEVEEVSENEVEAEAE